MELIFTRSSGRTWLVYDKGSYTLDLSCTRMRTWQDHLLRRSSGKILDWFKLKKGPSRFN